IRHVDQHQFRVGQPSQRTDMAKNRLIGLAIFNRDEDGVVHRFDYGASQLRKVCIRSHALSNAMMVATSQESDFSTGPFANSPILILSLVNRTRGKTAKLNCKLRMTWLRTSRFVVPFSPEIIVTMTAGMIAIRRVIRRRNHGRIRRFRNPSITIWPASVPVRVEFCPEASSANANTALAPVTPSSGVSRWYACWISATSVRPARWNVAAATIRMAALMNRAKLRSTA